MKKISLYIGATIFLLLLGACGNSGSAEQEGAQQNDGVVHISSVDSDAEVWDYIANSDAAQEAGLEIEVTEITGGTQSNNAVADGDVDANAFQSIEYLKSYNEESETNLIPIATTYMEPMGLYSDKYDSVEDLPNGAQVALADNPANTARGLRLLESAGLITLEEDFDDGLGTPDDIAENLKNLEFSLIDDLTGPRVLSDLDLIPISNTVALEGGLNVLEDAIYHEEVNDDNKGNFNIIAVQEGREDEEDLQKLGEIYHDPEIQEYIDEEFEGTKVEVDESIDEVWGE
ncbi:putative ABC transporter substrate-binding protein [Tetragenococcus halophilus subsp. halophilus]|uniref:ABC transporter substrate-binding protein n=1 Tax=Tetragenococcus halophilus (strain DSM 20338 / JCM 20259 / NCIMB 9735 / NBRC 12172) TaxID=945021 RepID=A0AAN1VQU8_TETHN|nr:MetQ/NlpA family ABC transporter substrate-binding protein [Tetragenococcus halophilus]AOF48540.1 metal ABC transporter substrate-binding protein [Tetragenococcus halophilus]NWN99685.1 metal ABC transporter substrate-binding protein [Tetragenococcus halophilus]RQD32470.1 metal ABC transporter substrate-binding protein [Tetragenococcus halophilus subsp. halophilus DSM 20339]WJS81222.1 metal ABC transporter substrate-binding protein [Tetragenococcus halophilus]BAK94368.1 putative ABC transpor